MPTNLAVGLVVNAAVLTVLIGFATRIQQDRVLFLVTGVVSLLVHDAWIYMLFWEVWSIGVAFIVMLIGGGIGLTSRSIYRQAR